MVARFSLRMVAAVIGASMICGAATGPSKRSQTDEPPEKFAAGEAPNKISRMPYLFGRSRVDADTQVRAAGLRPRFTGSAAPGATVVTQSVEAGRQLPAGTVVSLRMDIVQGGYVTAPPLLGLNHDAAATRAEAAGLKPIFYGPNGYGVVVASQSVPPNEQVARGTYVQLQMRAVGVVAMVHVPRFIDLSVEAARVLAQTNRLRPVFSGDESPGAKVIAQTPPGGAEAEPNADVQLSLGAPQIRAPNFIGRSRAGAQALASRSGLTLTITGADDDLARVARQSPRAGSDLTPGESIAIVMADPASAGSTPPVSGDAGTGPSSVQTSAGGTTAAATGPSKPGGAGKWITIIGGLGLVGGVATFLARRRRKRRRRKESDLIDKPIIHGPSEPRKTADPPLPAVTYAARVDPGRPTARFKDEPRAAARPLVLSGNDGSPSCPDAMSPPIAETLTLASSVADQDLTGLASHPELVARVASGGIPQAAVAASRAGLRAALAEALRIPVGEIFKAAALRLSIGAPDYDPPEDGEAFDTLVLAPIIVESNHHPTIIANCEGMSFTIRLEVELSLDVSGAELMIEQRRVVGVRTGTTSGTARVRYAGGTPIELGSPTFKLPGELRFASPVPTGRVHP
jgi:beta-lactam-binding protein with PASTA domain